VQQEDVKARRVTGKRVMGKNERTKVQRKEAERMNFRIARPTSRRRCNVAVVTKKGRHSRHPQTEKKRIAEKVEEKTERPTSLS